MKVCEVDISKTHNAFIQNSQSHGGTNINGSSNNGEQKISSIRKISNVSGSPWSETKSETASSTRRRDEVKPLRAKVSEEELFLTRAERCIAV